MTYADLALLMTMLQEGGVLSAWDLLDVKPVTMDNEGNRRFHATLGLGAVHFVLDQAPNPTRIYNWCEMVLKNAKRHGEQVAQP